MKDNRFLLEKNILEFVEKQGIEGFFRLYVQEFLMEVFRIAVQSRSPNEDADVAYQYYFDKNGEMRSRTELDRFDKGIEARIGKIADRIIRKLHDLGFFSELAANIDTLEIPPDKVKILDNQLQSAMKEVVGTRWGQYVRD